jgi:hypothetical protein
MIPEPVTALAAKAAIGFSTVLGKYAANRLLRAEPVKAAIGEVDRAFAGRIENVRRELERWLTDPEVQSVLQSMQAAPTREGPSTVLVTRFLSGEFFAGPDTEAAASEILDAFLTALDAAMLRDPALGAPVADARNAQRFQALDRNVSEIRRLLHSPSAEADDAYHRARARSESARAQLNPHSLPRIPRTHAAEKIRSALRRGIVNGTPRVVPITAAAGYGKSTLLGQLYDELTADPETGWVVLLLAADLPATVTEGRYGPTELAQDLGELAGTAGASLAVLSAGFTRERGRGVILIDTLDLVLTRGFVAAFRVVLEDLLAAGATVAFTCRDYEYSAFLADHAVLGTAAPAIDRHGLRDFDEDEVRAAATAFVQRHLPIRIPRGESTFADALLSLSAGSHSLREIVHNPLRLAMLCELFGRDLSVPEDLTASRLYSIYWDRKVASSRKYGPDAPVTLRMEQLCLQMARLLFQHSDEHLREAVFTSDLLADSEAAAAAYSELVSEDVLQPASGRRVRFFHQTFLEYTIARLAATSRGRAERETLLDRVSRPEAASARLHLWPVLRQLVSIVDLSELDGVIARVGVERQAAFRALALGMAARDDGAGLEKLLPIALSEGAGFQELLVNAAFTAPAGRSDTAWDVVLEIVRRAEKPTVINAAKIAGAMLSRFANDSADRLAGFFNALHANSGLAIRDRTEVAGFFVSEGREWLNRAPADHVLPALRRHWQTFGDDTQAAVVQLHGRPHVLDAQRTEMLDVLLSGAPGRRWRDDAAALLESAAPSLVGPAGRWRSWMDLLYATLPSGWSVVQALVVGRRAAHDVELLRSLARDLVHGGSQRIQPAQLALSEACRCGAGAALAEALMGAEGDPPPADRYAALARFISSAAAFIPDEGRLRLVRWLYDPASPDVGSTLAILATAADLDASVRDGMLELVSALPAAERDTMITLVLRLVQPSIQADVAGHLLLGAAGDMPNPTPGLLKLHALRASTDAGALEQLLAVARGHAKKLALQAATAVAEAAPRSDLLTDRELVDLLRSGFPGVQVSALSGLASLLDRGKVSEQSLGDAALALLDCATPVVIGPYCDLVTRWMRASRRPPMAALRFIASLPDRITATPPDSGIARTALIALKVAAQTEDDALRAELSSWTIRYFRWLDVQRIGDGEGELIDLLAACRRIDPGFFPRLIDAAEGVPLRNLRAAAAAIKRVEGAGSPHLDRLAAQPWCPMPVQGMILGFRGA